MYAWLCLIVILPLCLGSSNKRLLLNDPDVQAHLQNLEQQIKQLTQEVKLLKENERKAGSTYIRWGRTQCPSVSEMVYQGFAAGQRHDRSPEAGGGPTNTLCLPRDPDLSNTTLTPDWSRIYGTEYESNIFAQDSQDNDVPCAVCRNDKAISSIMIPGRRSCYSGWVKEYQGILTSGYEGYTPSTYLCVDSSPEYLQHGEKNENGHLFYPAKTKCGALPCPPYHDDILVECVVCSK